VQAFQPISLLQAVNLAKLHEEKSVEAEKEKEILVTMSALMCCAFVCVAIFACS